MLTIRILLATMPQMLGDIVRQTLEGQADLELVGEVRERRELATITEQTRPDVMVLGLRSGESCHQFRHLLDEYPQLRLLALTADGRTAQLYELKPQLTTLLDVSPRTLLELIRSYYPANH
jgi:DNA-binding NarL/FixJ family response regulator